MNILFIHPNFPAQFRHMAGALGGDRRNRVVFATANPRPEWEIKGVEKAVYTVPEAASRAHPLARNFDTAVVKGEAVYELVKGLMVKEFYPDVVAAHSGWGTTLFLRDLLPHTPLFYFFEWYYRSHGADADFDLNEPMLEQGARNVRAKNPVILMDLEACDFGYCPTRWQASQFPTMFRHKIAVRHDGIDTDFFQPRPGARLELPGLDLPADAEVVTYATRGMEPYRGFPQFMEAAPHILERRPKAHVVVAGADRVCYGRQLGKQGGKERTWKGLMLERITPRLGKALERLHFVGSLPYGQYRSLLQASSAHIYLTRPFVLSWSFLEAMASGCLVVASDTEPVREVVTDGENGLLFDFFSSGELAAKVVDGLERADDMARVRAAARRTVVERYALKKLLPGHIKIMENLANAKSPMTDVVY